MKPKENEELSKLSTSQTIANIYKPGAGSY